MFTVRICVTVVASVAVLTTAAASAAEKSDVATKLTLAIQENRILDAVLQAFGRVEDESRIPPETLKLSQTERAELKIALLANIETVRDGLKDADLAVRIASARGVSFVDDKASSVDVVRLLDDDDPTARAAAAFALSVIGSIENEERLILAASDPNSDVRAAALYAMRRLMVGEVAAVRGLRDEVVAVREQAANLLAEVRPYDPRLAQKAAKALQDALTDESVEVRSASATALGRLGLPEVTPALIRAASDQHDDVASAAVRALGDIGGAAAADGLIPIARGGGGLSGVAAEGLGRSGVRSQGVVDALANMVDEASATSARAAVKALGSLGGERAVDALLRAARGKRTKLLPELAHACARLGELAPAGLLLRRLSDDDRWVSLTAARGLARLGNPAGFPVFIRMLESDDAKMRAYSAACLALYSGTNMDFVPAGDGKDRSKTAWAWKRWWQKNKETFVVPHGAAAEVR